MADQGSARAGGPNGYTRRVLVALGLGLAAVGVIVLLWKAVGILLLVFASVLLATLLRGLGDQLARRTPLGPRAAVTVVLLVSVVLWGLGGWLLGPKVADQVTELTDRLPTAAARIKLQLRDSEWGRWIARRIPASPAQAAAAAATAGDGEDGGDGRDDGGGGAGEAARQIMAFFSTVLGILGNLAFILFAGVYFALGPSVYVDGVVRLFPVGRRPRIREVLDLVEHQLRWWLVGRFSSMAVVAVLTTVGLLIIGMPFAVTLGILAGLLSFVPVIGPIASAVPALVISLAQGPASALSVAVVYSVVQILESYVITPLIQQRAVSLPPVLILLSQLFFGLAAGFVGVAMATPLTVSLIVLVKTLYVQDVLGDREVSATLAH